MQEHYETKQIIGWMIALILLVWLPGPAANAQSDTEVLEAARECQRIPELSARLACYDRALPPGPESAADDALLPAPAPPAAEPEPVPRPAPPRERVTAEPQAEPAPPPAALPPAGRNRRDAAPITAQIVEVESVSAGTTHFHAADGRVFVRANASRIYSWPEPPFEVEIQYSRFGSTFLKFDSGLRVRVANLD